MRTIVLLFSLSCLPASVPAAPLHKCFGADAVPSYQSLPCAPGQRTAWTRAASPVAHPPEALPAAAAPAARLRTASPRTQAIRTGSPRTQAGRQAVDPSASRCTAARRSADLTRDRLWNRLSFRQRSDLDAKVAQACVRR